MRGALDEETVLSGPSHAVSDVVIDAIYGKPLRDVAQDCIRDLLQEANVPVAAIDPIFRDVVASTNRQNTVWTVPGAAVMIKPVALAGGTLYSPGFMAIHGDADGATCAGLFSGADLVVAQEFRGRGIGSALVATRLLHDGGLPTWEHDEPAYTPAGAACVVRGLWVVQDILDMRIAERAQDIPAACAEELPCP